MSHEHWVSDSRLTLLVFVVAWQPMHTGSRGAEIVAVDVVPCTQFKVC
jgi:hypothetical protein